MRADSIGNGRWVVHVGALALGLAVFALPLAAEAQLAGKVYRIGYLSGLSRDGESRNIEAFRQGLREVGYVDGENIAIEYRWAEGKADGLPDLAAELVRLRVDVILAAGPDATVAVKAATTTIPVVFVVVADPVGLGIVSSLARPGGNITGFATVASRAIVGKHLELLKEVVPKASRIAVLVNPSFKMHALILPDSVAAAKALKVRLQIVEARGPDEFESAFQAATRERAEAIHVYGDSVTLRHRARIAELAARNRLPAIYLFNEYVEAGGLMSYGPSRPDLYHRASTYVGKSLKGAKPADLPVQQPTKFEFVINMKTAKALGLTIPPSLLLRADHIVQ